VLSERNTYQTFGKRIVPKRLSVSLSSSENQRLTSFELPGFSKRPRKVAKPVMKPAPPAIWQMCGVEVRRGGLGRAYLLPTLSLVGASLALPCVRFHTPLIEPDVRICRIRLSEKTHTIAVAIACDAVCNF
jgi:hypothetical protein